MTVSYHDLHITTTELGRIAISDMPFGYMVTCTRVGGWELWLDAKLVAGEFDKDRPLALDVAGTTICSMIPLREVIRHRSIETVVKKN